MWATRGRDNQSRCSNKVLRQVSLISRGYSEVKTKFIECGNHGNSKPAFICYHLVHEVSVGWNEPEVYDKGEDDPFYGCINAWCDMCEAKAISTGDWNDESEAFANIQLICEICALRIREANLN